MCWRQRLRDHYRQVQAERHREWPYADDEFVSALELVDRDATDDGRGVVAQLEDAER